MTPEDRIRAKIDLLNYIKRHATLKNIHGDNPHYQANLTDELRCLNSMLQGVNGVNRVSTGWCQPLLGLKPRASLLTDFSKTAEQKQTPLVPSVTLLEIRIILKNEANRNILRGVIAKTVYRTKRPWRRDTPPELKLNT